jgi:chromosome segregation ATPase
MNILLVCIAALITSLVFIGLLFAGLMRGRSSGRSNLANLENELQQKQGFKNRIEQLYQEMVDLTTLRELNKELRVFEDSLRAERGRFTITQAELETVEARLRELGEIERELEASGLETQEEMKILQKKQEDLRNKNQNLKKRIADSVQKINVLMGEIELSTVAQEQMAAMQTELLQTERKVDVLIVQIEEGNEQYFILKKRYDALDIEYAQLYEKFAAVEG